MIMTPGMILAKGFYWLCILVGGSIALSVIGFLGVLIICLVADTIRGK